MRVEERLALEREASQWVAEWQRQSEDAWATTSSRILAVVDDECQGALIAGRKDMFGSVASIRPEWDRLIDALIPQPGNEPAFRDALFAATLQRLVADGDLLFVTDRQRVRSRFFETVHYIRNLRQRTNKHSQIDDAPELVEMIKAEAVKRERPIRSLNHDAMLEGVRDVIARLQGTPPPPWAGDVNLDDIAQWALNVFENFLGKAFAGFQFAQFQADATREILNAAFFDDNPAGGLAVAAGTGFGKTEAFLLPLLFHALVYKAVSLTRQQHGVSAVLVYPRRDLCNDQAARLVGYLVHLNAAMREHWSEQFGDTDFSPLQVSVAHGGTTAKIEFPCPLCANDRRVEVQAGTWTADDDQRARLAADPDSQDGDLHRLFKCVRAGDRHAAAAECVVYQIHSQGDPADLAITNLDTLHRRLMDGHGKAQLFARRALPPRVVVLDEMHVYEGQSGVHAANIVRRLRQRARSMPESNGAEIVIVGASATVFDPLDLLVRLSGIAATELIAIQPGPDERAVQGREYYSFVQSPGNQLQRIGLSDDEEEHNDSAAPVPERFVSEQATMIQAAMSLQHTMKAPGGAGIRKRRTLGFVDSLDLAARLARNFDNAEWQDAGPTGSSQTRPMTKAPLYTLRLPTGRPGVQLALAPAIGEAAALVRGSPSPRPSFAAPGQDCPRFAQQDCLQPPHHLLERCRRYELGECWFAMGLNHEEGLRPTVTQRHQSGQRNWASPDLRFNRSDDPNAWRMLISTSALEIGFDHPELIATWQYHAPETVASFLQRKGRGGRSASDRPITMMVLGNSAADIFAFQHHSRYVEVDSARDLACWVDPDNPALQRQHMIAALFDYCAARGRQQAYSMLDFHLLDQTLSREWVDAIQWIVDCFGVVPARVEPLLREFQKALREFWLRPLVPAGTQWGAGPREPPKVFRDSKSAELRTRAQMLQGDAQEIVRAREWLQAMAARKSESDFRVTAPDFFQALPQWALPDNDLRLPTGTVPEPLGRDIELYRDDGSNIARDPAEFVLSAFLPGGFKIRYDNKLWAAPWTSAPGWQPAANSQLSRAVLSIYEPGRPVSDLVPDIRASDTRSPVGDFLREKTALDTVRRTELLARLGNDTDVVFVAGLKLREVGGVRGRRFTFDSSLNVVHSSAQNVAATNRQLQVRDPNLSPQREILPLRPKDQVGSTVVIPPFRAIRHYRRQPLVVLHTGNLVHCYPQDGGERTIAVHFHSADAPSRRIAPAVLVQTEALELVPDAPPVGLWRPDAIARIFWQRVSERLPQLLVVERGLLRSSYLVEGCLEALAALEDQVGEFATNPPDVPELQRRVDSESEWLVELRDLEPYIQAVVDTLAEAASYTAKTGRDRAWIETLTAAFVRVGADRLQASPAIFRTLFEPSNDGWRALVFDDNEGGSGNARRLRELLKDWSDVRAELAALTRCPVAEADAAIEDVLSSEYSADSLALLRAEGKLRDILPTTPEPTAMTLRRLERLFEDANLAAFNLHAARVATQVNRTFGALAPTPRATRALRRAPALDPRAEELRRAFRKGGASELPSRLRAVRPLCVSGCPYCIGLNEISFADRTLLSGLHR